MTRSEVPTEFLDQPAPTASGSVWDRRPRWHATKKQVDFIAGLLAQRELPAEAAKQFADRVAAAEAGDWEHGISFDRASGFITRLKALPKKLPARGGAMKPNPMNRVQVEFTEVQLDGDKKPRTVGHIVLPDGRKLLAGSYGIDTSDDDRFINDTSFFKVWANADFGRGWGVKLYVSDDTSKVGLAHGTQDDVVKAILDAGPEAAAKLFGLEFKRCGICGRGLTKDVSRELGIGPICRARLAL